MKLTKKDEKLLKRITKSLKKLTKGKKFVALTKTISLEELKKIFS